MKLLHFMIVSVTNLRGNGKRHKADRTGLDTFAAANTDRFFRFERNVVLKQQNAGTELGYRGVDIDGGSAHHRAAENDFADFGRIAVHFADEERRRSTDANHKIGRRFGSVAADGNNALKQRLVFLNRLVNGIDRADILDDAADIGRQFS